MLNKDDATNYSPAYQQAITDAEAFCSKRLTALPPLTLTLAEYEGGTDSLTDPYAAVVSDCIEWLLVKKDYALSYSQICRAFFSALNRAGKLSVEKKR